MDASDGEVVRLITAKEMAQQGVDWEWVHSLQVQLDGLLLVSGGYGASLATVDNNNKVKRAMSDELKKQLELKFIAGVCRLSNGHLLVSAYNSKHGIFELDRDFNLVRTFMVPSGINPSAVQLMK